MSRDEHDLSGLDFQRHTCLALKFPSNDHVCDMLPTLGVALPLIVPLIFQMLICQEPIFQIMKIRLDLTTGGVNFKGAILDNAKFDNGVKQKLHEN